jgi:hypothetical protein
MEKMEQFVIGQKIAIAEQLTVATPTRFHELKAPKKRPFAIARFHRNSRDEQGTEEFGGAGENRTHA